MTSPYDADPNPITGRPIHWPEPGLHSQMDLPNDPPPPPPPPAGAPFQVAGATPKDGTYYLSVLFEKAAIRSLIEEIRNLPEHQAPLVRQLGRLLREEYLRMARMDREVGRPRRAGRREFGSNDVKQEGWE